MITASAALPLLPMAMQSTIPWNPLFVFIMAVAVAVVLLIAALVTYVVVRFRARPDAPIPRPVHADRRLEIGWTVTPALVVLFTFGLSFYTMRTTPTPGAEVVDLPGGQVPDIQVIGHQWWWEFRYPQYNVVTANVLHIPVGRPVFVTLTSADVQHDFWVPELGQKMDMYPGKVNYIWLNAEAPGVYEGACAEFCGVQHAWMRIRVVAQSEADFAAWIRDQQTPASPATEPLAQRGQVLFGERNCGACHNIAGTAYAGRAGPDLSHFGSRPTISAGVLVNTPENLARYLRDPNAVKPGIFMPNVRLTEEEIAALVAYLESLR